MIEKIHPNDRAKMTVKNDRISLKMLEVHICYKSDWRIDIDRNRLSYDIKAREIRFIK